MWKLWEPYSSVNLNCFLFPSGNLEIWKSGLFFLVDIQGYAVMITGLKQTKC
jgi:hypothetical protein